MYLHALGRTWIKPSAFLCEETSLLPKDVPDYRIDSLHELLPILSLILRDGLWTKLTRTLLLWKAENQTKSLVYCTTWVIILDSNLYPVNIIGSYVLIWFALDK